MIRAILVVILIIALAAAALAFTGDPGRANLVWLGWRVDMTASSAMLLSLFAALVAALIWRLVIWIVEAPQRAQRARADQRRRQAGEALSRGFLAVAAGDGSEARRLAQKAAELSDESPALTRVLAAQAAEAAGDLAAARTAYNAMLGFPEMRLAGLRGLMLTAQADGEPEIALRHAETAYGLAKTARWAWRALFDARIAAGDWAAALTLVQGALERKIVSPLIAERARAALLAASAAELEQPSPARREGDEAPPVDERKRAQALDFAQQAAKLRPDFAPGVVMAARLLAADGKLSRAANLIESAWKAAPHPALWLAFRDLRPDETPRLRAVRLAGLAALNPEARESRLLRVEQALVANDGAGARLAAHALDAELAEPTARLCGLMARVAYTAGDRDEARAWMARGIAAPQEPDWSDLDPEGHAFAYTRQDWARLAASYAETGELIHPRFERRERTISDLPQIPLSYEESTPFVRGVTAGHELLAPVPDNPGVGGFDDEEGEDEAAAMPEAQPRRTRRPRRLASGPRPAK
ncbi:MAG: heme biosynthesis protein HemY [Caulobacterales bacterium 68-7]|nr:MAG: heme biosynthesis protein HemY [Caulobacterales bacterium 68-7]